MNCKESYLKIIEAIPISELWDSFLNVQANLFFNKEFGLIFGERWWVEARKVLQIGSQNGQLLALLANEFPEKKYVGLEKEPDFVRSSQEKFQKDSLSFLKRNIEVFYEEFSNQFDVIIFHLTLQDLKEPRKTLEHAFHYLKKEGHIFIIDSHDASRKSSYLTPILDQTVKILNDCNRKTNKGNRLITLEIQNELKNSNSSLWPYFKILFSNLDDTGGDAPDGKQIILHSEEVGSLYLDYYMMFLEILKKEWEIEVNLEQAYEEANYFVKNKSSWLRSGKHALTLQKCFN
jgi:SAM-dependent methyltransferase